MLLLTGRLSHLDDVLALEVIVVVIVFRLGLRNFSLCLLTLSNWFHSLGYNLRQLCDLRLLPLVMTLNKKLAVSLLLGN